MLFLSIWLWKIRNEMKVLELSGLGSNDLSTNSCTNDGKAVLSSLVLFHSVSYKTKLSVTVKRTKDMHAKLPMTRI